jgi:hypothetical protein
MTALITLAEAKTHLNITVATYDAELQTFLDSLTAGVEYHIGGPVIIRNVVESVKAVDGGRALVLAARPFVSLVGILAGDGLAVSTTDVYAEPGRILRRRFGVPFPKCDYGPYQVTVTAGLDPTTAPEAVKMAVKIITGHMWSGTQRGRVGRGLASGNSEMATPTTYSPGFGFAVPNRALWYFAPYSIDSGRA